ncbi:unnamed protein product [Oreochromis niloticus]|nr:unnamed protein product [Mustela putorius furo]
MNFSLEDFVEAPSWEKNEKCKKADLLIVANSYNVEVSYSARKAELKETLPEKLVEKGVLLYTENKPVKGADDAASKADANAADASAAGMEADRISESSEGTSTEDLRLTLRIREVETRNKELEVQAMQLRIRALELEKGSAKGSPMSSSTSVSSSASFDVSKHITLVPPFCESEVDSYFSAFERIAAALKWPKEFWSLLLQCKLVGKAQEVCSSLSIDQSLN